MQSTILHMDNIKLNVDLNSKQEVFDYVADFALKNNLITSRQDILNGLFERERLSTTGFFDGFAIPHVISESVDVPSIVILKTKNGIDWNALDGKLTSFFIVLLIPETSENVHLNILSSIARLLMDEDVRKKLLLAHDKEEIYEYFSKAIAEKEKNEMKGR